MKTCLGALGAFFAIAPATLFAQDGPSGIAYVQAPELSSGVCMGDTAAEAFACATQICIDEGGTEQDCLEISYCNPARTSADVFLQHKEGIHWHEFICGLDSVENAMAVAEAVCDREQRPYLIECAAVLLYDQEGEAMEPPAAN